MLLLNLLIIFFIFLILYQLFSYILENHAKFREGMDSDSSATYQDYNDNDPLILSKQNAGNISYLKQRLDNLEPLIPIVADLSTNMVNLNDQMIALTQSQTTSLQQMNDVATQSVS